MEYKNKWHYNNIEVEDIDKQYQGFVYIITDLETKKMYVGKKFTKSMKKIPNKNRRTTIESDWKNYYSSNEFIKTEAKKNPFRFKREILMFCLSRGETNFYETEEQFIRGVLRSDAYLNEHISSRWYKKNVIKYQQRT